MGVLYLDYFIKSFDNLCEENDIFYICSCMKWEWSYPSYSKGSLKFMWRDFMGGYFTTHSSEPYNHLLVGGSHVMCFGVL